MRPYEAAKNYVLEGSLVNYLAESTDDFNRRFSRTNGLRKGGGYPDQNVVRIRNDTGEDRRIGEVVGLEDPIVLPEDNPVQFSRFRIYEGVTPDISLHRFKFGILTTPCRDGYVTFAVRYGAVAALVNVTDESHVFANVKTGEYILESAHTGFFEMFWKEPDLSEAIGETWTDGIINDEGVVWARTLEDFDPLGGPGPVTGDIQIVDDNFQDIDGRVETGLLAWVTGEEVLPEDTRIKCIYKRSTNNYEILWSEC